MSHYIPVDSRCPDSRSREMQYRRLSGNVPGTGLRCKKGDHSVPSGPEMQLPLQGSLHNPLFPAHLNHITAREHGVPIASHNNNRATLHMHPAQGVTNLRMDNMHTA